MLIGVGVFATRSFERGDFLLEYFGSLIPKEKGELVLEKNLQGSFVYFFEHNSKELWWDVLISFDDLLTEYTKLCHAHFKKFFLEIYLIYSNLMTILQLNKIKERLSVTLHQLQHKWKVSILRLWVETHSCQLLKTYLIDYLLRFT